MGYLQNLFNTKKNRPNTVATAASKITKVMSPADIKMIAYPL